MNDKWLNNIATLESRDYDNGTTSTWIYFKEDFEAVNGNSAVLERHSDRLKALLERKEITEEFYNELMKKDVESDGGTIFYVIHVSPQEDKGSAPIDKFDKDGWKNDAIQLRTSKKDLNKMYVFFKKDFKVRKGTKIFLRNVIEEIKNNPKLDKEQKAERLRKMEIMDESGKPTGKYFLKYSGNVGPESYYSQKLQARLNKNKAKHGN